MFRKPLTGRRGWKGEEIKTKVKFPALRLALIDYASVFMREDLNDSFGVVKK
jgi:hypothetical protein